MKLMDCILFIAEFKEDQPAHHKTFERLIYLLIGTSVKTNEPSPNKKKKFYKVLDVHVVYFDMITV